MGEGQIEPKPEYNKCKNSQNLKTFSKQSYNKNTKN
jgi:hypothetical protein